MESEVFVVIAYDIQDDRRRTTLADLLEGYGTRVQKSVFECVLAQKDLRALMRQVEPLVETPEESVRYYVVCSRCLERSSHTRGLPLSRDSICYIA